MKTSLIAAVSLVALTACTALPDTETGGDVAPAETAKASPAVAARLEAAQRKVDVGQGPAAAADLAAVQGDASATQEQRDQAALGLARALAAKGDDDGAIAALEKLIQAYWGGRGPATTNEAESLLRKLVTGAERAPTSQPSRSEESVAAPFARVLMAYFPTHRTNQGERREVSAYFFGGSSATSERLGTFNVARAIRDEAAEACSLCDAPNVWTHLSRSGDWVGIAQAGEARRREGVAVYYESLDGRMIPARYEADVPMKSADVEARLRRGEGVVAVKEREGAPPSILIAAPRGAQMAEVEAALAKMTSIPAEPVTVKLTPGLTSDEMRDVVQGSRKAQRGCYDELLARTPAAEGTLKLKLSVGVDGAVTDASAEPTPGVRDEAFEACMIGVAKGLAFPATGESGKVVVPVRLAHAR